MVQNRQISELGLVLPVVPDVLNVVVVLQHVDELGHVLDITLIGQGDVVLRNHLDFGAGKGVALLFQPLEMTVFPRLQNRYF